MLYNKRHVFRFILSRPIYDVDVSELARSLGMMYADHLRAAGNLGACRYVLNQSINQSNTIFLQCTNDISQLCTMWKICKKYRNIRICIICMFIIFHTNNDVHHVLFQAESNEER